MKWFEHTYLINLESRKDRLESVINELNKLNIEFETVSAVDGDKEDISWDNSMDIHGWNKNSAALLETTINIINDAIDKGYETIQIFEDDVFFEKNINTRLERLMFPEDGEWDMFHFGVIHELSAPRINKDIIRLRRSYCCHSYAIHSRVFKDYLNRLEQRDRPIDWVTTDYFQPHGRCYAPNKTLAFQKPDYSNIRKKEVHNKMT